MPWTCEHDLELHYDDYNELRILLAQPVNYIQDLDCAYGFLSTYRGTGLWNIRR